jgi:hypothetical protein
MEKGEMCYECDGGSPGRVRELEFLIKGVLERSLPYVFKYNAFLIQAEDWMALSHAVSLRSKLLASLLEKRERGEEVTQEEIDEFLRMKE